MNGLMQFLMQGGAPPQQQPGLSGVNPSVMQFLQMMMSQPGGNPFGAQSMEQLPQFGTPFTGGVPVGLPMPQEMPSQMAPPQAQSPMQARGGQTLGGSAVPTQPARSYPRSFNER